MELEIGTIKEETGKQLQEAEMVLEMEKQKLLKVCLSINPSSQLLNYDSLCSYQELSRGKTEALKLMDEDMDLRVEEVKREKDAQWEAVLANRCETLDRLFIKPFTNFRAITPSDCVKRKRSIPELCDRPKTIIVLDLPSFKKKNL